MFMAGRCMCPRLATDIMFAWFRSEHTFLPLSHSVHTSAAWLWTVGACIRAFNGVTGMTRVIAQLENTFVPLSDNNGKFHMVLIGRIMHP